MLLVWGAATKALAFLLLLFAFILVAVIGGIISYCILALTMLVGLISSEKNVFEISHPDGKGIGSVYVSCLPIGYGRIVIFRSMT